MIWNAKVVDMNEKDFLLEKDAEEEKRELLGLELLFAVTHAVFLITFFFQHVTIMVYYNVFSILYFLFLYAYMKKHDLTVLQLDMLDSVEFVIHQILAVICVGREPGFQYILLGIVTPMIGMSITKKTKRYIFVKSVCILIIYVVLTLLAKNVWTPIYAVDQLYADINCVCMIALVVILMSAMEYNSFSRLQNKIVSQYSEREKGLQDLIGVQRKMISGVASIIESRDETTGEHTRRTSEYVYDIAKEMQKEGKYPDILTDDYIDLISSAAVLHDVGKIKTPDHILRKPGKLEPEEYDIIKHHSSDGGEIIRTVFDELEDNQYVEEAYCIALYHHERWDGTGYPLKLAGEQIPLSARIMAVADVFDALISKRHYKDAFPLEKAIQIIREGEGTQFQPEVVAAFLNSVVVKLEK